MMMQKGRIPILIDTDIGDDIDDAAAIIMALNSPELEILTDSMDYPPTDPYFLTTIPERQPIRI